VISVIPTEYTVELMSFECGGNGIVCD